MKDFTYEVIIADEIPNKVYNHRANTYEDAVQEICEVIKPLAQRTLVIGLAIHEQTSPTVAVSFDWCNDTKEWQQRLF